MDKKYLTLDIGTTCCKCQLFNSDGEILFYKAEEYSLAQDSHGNAFIDIAGLTAKVKALIALAAKKGTVASLAISSLGESFVLLDDRDNILALPMLYTNPRGDKSASAVAKEFGTDRWFGITGVAPHAMYSVFKLLWLKEHMPEVYAKADKLMLLGDYIGYVLTGKRVIDYSLASRTGVFDVRRKCFSDELLSDLNISPTLFSRPALPGSVVGKIKGNIAKELSLPDDCVLILGAHDQVCATLGAGVLQAGEAADGMGTVECITTVFDDCPDDSAFGNMGYPVVPYALDGLYCTYAVNYSSGSMIDWYRKKLLHGYAGDRSDFFEYMEANIPDSPSELLALPYFSGAGTPYYDVNAKGAIIGLDLGTSDADIYRALLESTAYEMRVNLDALKQFGINIDSVVATGGGARSKDWLQIKSDITRLKVSTLRSSEGGLCGLAMLQAVAAGSAIDLPAARNVFVRTNSTFSPTATAIYEKKYEKYKKIYSMIKELY